MLPLSRQVTGKTPMDGIDLEYIYSLTPSWLYDAAIGRPGAVVLFFAVGVLANYVLLCGLAEKRLVWSLMPAPVLMFILLARCTFPDNVGEAMWNPFVNGSSYLMLVLLPFAAAILIGVGVYFTFTAGDPWQLHYTTMALALSKAGFCYLYSWNTKEY